MTEKMIKNILLVCTGNICRSPMAECILRHRLGGKKDISIQSAGVHAVDGTAASENAVKVLREWDMDLSPHRSRRLTDGLVMEADLILVMTEAHKSEVLRQWPEAGEKVRLLCSFGTQGESRDIPDPIGLSLDAYRRIRDEIDSAISDLILYLM